MNDIIDKVVKCRRCGSLMFSTHAHYNSGMYFCNYEHALEWKIDKILKGGCNAG